MANEVSINDVGLAAPDPRVAIVRPDSAENDYLKDMSGIAGEAIAGIQGYRASAAGKKSIQALEAIQALNERGFSFDKSTGSLTEESLDRLMESDDPALVDLRKREREIYGKSNQVFTRLGKRFAQSGMEATTAEAKVLIEREVRNIAGMTPGFTDIVRKAAADTLGFDPLGFTADLILSQTDPKSGSGGKTEHEKFLERVELRYEQEKTVNPGVNKQDIYNYMSQEEMYKQDFEYTKTRLENGAISIEEAANKLFLNQNSWKTFYSSHVTNMSSGVYYGMDETQARLATLQNQKQAELDAIRRLYVDKGQAHSFNEADWRASIDNKYSGVEALVSNTDLAKVLTDKQDVLQKMAIQTAWQITPQTMFRIAAFGPDLAGKFIDMLYTASNEGTKNMLIELQPELKAVFGEKGDMTPFMENFSSVASSILTGGPMPKLHEDPDVNAKAVAAYTDIMGGDKKADGNTQASIYKSMYENEGPKSAFNYIVRDPKYFFSLPQDQKQQVAADFTTSVKTVARNIAAEMYEEGVEFKQLDRSQVQSGYVLQQAMEQGLPNTVYRTINPKTGKPTFFQNDDIKWLDSSVRATLSDPRMASGLTGGKLKSVEEFDVVIGTMVELNLRDMQMTEAQRQVDVAVNRLVKYQNSGGTSEEHIAGLMSDIEKKKAEYDESVINRDSLAGSMRAYREWLGEIK